MNKRKVVVGFSGGVDSAMTLKILQEQGFEPIAVFLNMFPGGKTNKVQRLADKIGVKLVVKNISNIFEDCIIKDFLDEYRNNRTPNPCVQCNSKIKFKFLLKIADELGIEKIATGHYAQVKEESGVFKLLKGLDEKKDQSYFLYRLTQKELARIIFPLGNLLKKNIEKEALRNDLFEKVEESQDLCFLDKKEKVQDFLRKNLNKVDNQPGEIKNELGEILGEHRGLFYYTQGQRKGLDLAGGPFYVIGKKIEENVLSVSKNKEHPALVNKEIWMDQVNWIVNSAKEGQLYFCKVRYQSQLIPGKMIKEKNNWKIVLKKSQWAVAEGQSLVIYNKNEILGGGIVKKV